MIRYQLKCDNGHGFEAWFLDGASYDKQARSGDVACPHCGDTRVAKAPMAPHLATSGIDRSEKGAEARAQEVAEQILQAVDGLRHEVEENCEYVGDEFADEARRIHYGDADERDIYGEATEDETEALAEEEIPFFRLPFGRRRNN